MSNRQIGWSIESNLLAKLQRKLKNQNGGGEQEIGWGTDNKLTYDLVQNAPCTPCVPATTSPSTTLPPV